MKKSLFCTLLLTLVTTLSFGQKKYVQPPPIIGEGFKIIISEIESLNNDSRFKLEIFNDSRDQYLTLDPEQIGVEYPI